MLMEFLPKEKKQWKFTQYHLKQPLANAPIVEKDWVIYSSSQQSTYCSAQDNESKAKARGLIKKLSQFVNIFMLLL